eukprot:SAG31_NODE_22499_length_524_cov_0.974118_1_plen_123_part_01
MRGFRQTHVVMLPGDACATASDPEMAAGHGTDLVPKMLSDYRAKLCRQTESAVERFDHFCPWVGNVVGVRNHRYFVVFVCAVVLLCAAVLATSAYVAFIATLGDKTDDCSHATSSSSGTSKDF